MHHRHYWFDYEQSFSDADFSFRCVMLLCGADRACWCNCAAHLVGQSSNASQCECLNNLNSDLFCLIIALFRMYWCCFWSLVPPVMQHTDRFCSRFKVIVRSEMICKSFFFFFWLKNVRTGVSVTIDFHCIEINVCSESEGWLRVLVSTTSPFWVPQNRVMFIFSEQCL